MVCSAFIQNSHFHFILTENENRNVVIDFRVLFFYYTSIFILGHLLNGVSLELGGRRQGIEEEHREVFIYSFIYRFIQWTLSIGFVLSLVLGVVRDAKYRIHSWLRVFLEYGNKISEGKEIKKTPNIKNFQLSTRMNLVLNRLCDRVIGQWP